MHLQTKSTQTKIISVVKGKILDVVIDCRLKSKNFGKHFKIILSDKNCRSLLIPAGFAHGFLTLDKENIVFYGNDNYRSANNEATISWNDPIIKINWPSGKKIISNKDKSGISFKEFVKKI
jgi:dTDP-4-dehydrorhamnose 3,5-epimerase